MAGKRWVMLAVPEPPRDVSPSELLRYRCEREIFGDGVMIREAPRGVGLEVRGATDQETGMFARLALPAVSTASLRATEGGES